LGLVAVQVILADPDSKEIALLHPFASITKAAFPQKFMMVFYMPYMSA
jgi:hypothetical protein